MNNLLKKLISLCLVISMVLGFTFTVNAAEKSSTPSYEVLKQCIKVDENGYFYLKNDSALDESQVTEAQQILQHYNSMIKEGSYIVNKNTMTVSPTNLYYEKYNFFVQNSRRGGVTKAKFVGGTLFLSLSNNSCNKILKGGDVGQILAGTIPNPVVAVAVELSIEAVKWSIQDNNKGNGVVLIFAGTTYVRMYPQK